MQLQHDWDALALCLTGFGLVILIGVLPAVIHWHARKTAYCISQYIDHGNFITTIKHYTQLVDHDGGKAWGWYELSRSTVSLLAYEPGKAKEKYFEAKSQINTMRMTDRRKQAQAKRIKQELKNLKS